MRVIALVGLGGLEPPTSSLSVEFKRLPDQGSARSMSVHACGRAQWDRAQLLSLGVVSCSGPWEPPASTQRVPHRS